MRGGPLRRLLVVNLVALLWLPGQPLVGVHALSTMPQRAPDWSRRKVTELVWTQHVPAVDEATQQPVTVQPLPQFLGRFFDTPSAARKTIRRGEIFVNDVQGNCGTVVYAGDVVTKRARAQATRYARVERADFPVVYEDDFLAVVNKPAGIAMHSGGTKQGPGIGGGNKAASSAPTVRSLLPSLLRPSESREEPLRRPTHVHRLDAPTSGLVVAAKTRPALVRLSLAFEQRAVHKTYKAIVVGRLEGQGMIDRPVEGQPSRSRWAAVEHTRSLRFGWLTTVRLEPETGRRHQLRRHLVEGLGFPILGDAKWGMLHKEAGTAPVHPHTADGGPAVDAGTEAAERRDDPAEDEEEEEDEAEADEAADVGAAAGDAWAVDYSDCEGSGGGVAATLAARKAVNSNANGMFLAAVRLSLAHPETGEDLTVAIDAPRKFAAVCQREQARWERHNGAEAAASGGSETAAASAACRALESA